MATGRVGAAFGVCFVLAVLGCSPGDGGGPPDGDPGTDGGGGDSGTDGGASGSDGGTDDAATGGPEAGSGFDSGARTDAGAPADCASDSHCDPGQFCDGDLCDGPGRCRAVPVETSCPSGFDAVCGCDGMTYTNRCHAEAAAVRVERDGSCSQTPCDDNSDCESDEFCNASTCDAAGSCQLEPAACPPFENTVCGCDGVTYDNGCRAHLAGTRVASEGACP